LEWWDDDKMRLVRGKWRNIEGW
jgi:hypothetical protein